METNTLAQQCYEKIRGEIIQGKILPGKKLAVVALSKAMGTGPTPVREALSRLASTGLVEANENQGFRVSALSEGEIRDLYRTFFQIESLALEQSIVQGDDLWASRVIAAQYRLSLIEDSTLLTLEKYPEWFARNLEFHTALISGCGSPCLLDIRNRLLLQFDRYIRLTIQLEPKNSPLDHSIHRALCDAVVKREKLQAKKLLKQDVLDGLDSLLITLKKHKIVT